MSCPFEKPNYRMSMKEAHLVLTNSGRGFSWRCTRCPRTRNVHSLRYSGGKTSFLSQESHDNNKEQHFYIFVSSCIGFNLNNGVRMAGPEEPTTVLLRHRHHGRGSSESCLLFICHFCWCCRATSGLLPAPMPPGIGLLSDYPGGLQAPHKSRRSTATMRSVAAKMNVTILCVGDLMVEYLWAHGSGAAGLSAGCSSCHMMSKEVHFYCVCNLACMSTSDLIYRVSKIIKKCQ